MTDHDGNPVRDGEGRLYTQKLDTIDHNDALNAAGRLTKEFRLALMGKTKEQPAQLFQAGLVLMSDREWVVWRTLKNEHGQCCWCVTRDGTLYLRTHLGQKCTQLGGSPSDFLATILVKEINNAKCDDRLSDAARSASVNAAPMGHD